MHGYSIWTKDSCFLRLDDFGSAIAQFSGCACPWTIFFQNIVLIQPLFMLIKRNTIMIYYLSALPPDLNYPSTLFHRRSLVSSYCAIHYTVIISTHYRLEMATSWCCTPSLLSRECWLEGTKHINRSYSLERDSVTGGYTRCLKKYWQQC